MTRDDIRRLIDAAAETGDLGIADLELIELPEELWQLTNLRQLSVHSNQLTELPAELNGLTSLSRLCFFMATKRWVFRRKSWGRFPVLHEASSSPIPAKFSDTTGASGPRNDR